MSYQELKDWSKQMTMAVMVIMLGAFLANVAYGEIYGVEDSELSIDISPCIEEMAYVAGFQGYYEQAYFEFEASCVHIIDQLIK